MSTLVKLIGLYELGNKNVVIMPLNELSINRINSGLVYKITTYFGEKTSFNHRHAQGKKHNFRYKISEKIATFYLGKEVQESSVDKIRYFDNIEGEDCIYLRLKNGEYMKASDRYEVIDSDNLLDNVKFIDLYDPQFCLSIGK